MRDKPPRCRRCRTADIEFGIGAGWMIDDYEWAGMQYDKPSVRIERLEEALTIIRSMWSKKKTTFDGRHYQVKEAPLKIEMPSPPQVLIGGGGAKLLAVAGRHADIVGINPKIPEGRITAATALDITPESIRQKIGGTPLRSGRARSGRDRTQRAGVHDRDYGRSEAGARDGRAIPV
jgi:alkanesulfonate monooxygenase SsuD/methylene tetrahydromethanopterin reductase-like flavin-dependent oxidoreductase (luciferase family)